MLKMQVNWLFWVLIKSEVKIETLAPVRNLSLYGLDEFKIKV